MLIFYHDLTRTVACGHVFFDILLFLLQIEAKRRRKWMTQKPGSLPHLGQFQGRSHAFKSGGAQAAKIILGLFI